MSTTYKEFEKLIDDWVYENKVHPAVFIRFLNKFHDYYTYSELGAHQRLYMESRFGSNWDKETTNDR